MTFTNILTKDELLQLQHLYKNSKEEALFYAEDKLQLRSKKKRIRKKFRKKIITELTNMDQLVHMETKQAEQEIKVDISGLPVTFLLGLGKEYFADLEVVKYYYTKSKDDFYKNKEKLIEDIEQAIKKESPSVQQEIIAKVEEKQK